MKKTIEIQEHLRRALPKVFGCRDYQEQEQLLTRVDCLLKQSGVERRFVGMVLESQEVEGGGECSQRELMRQSERGERALRCTVLKHLIGEDYREMSVRLAQCELFRWFCRLPELEVVRVPGKSTLQEYANILPANEMKKVLWWLGEAMSDEQRAREIGLERELAMDELWVDSTCLKANIHFPVDWVLLRDGVRTLIKAIATIRRHGLKVRMPEPEAFLSAINAQAMAMSAASPRKPGSKKARKGVLRKMKKICKVVAEHAQRYREALDENWQQTDLSRKEAEVILGRIQGVLSQLPNALKQAHERIIGERQVPNAGKILSLYQSDLHVIKRGKAGADVEFGNSLFIAEQADGYIVDHELLKESSPGDPKWLETRMEALSQATGERLSGIFSDRGFESKKNNKLVEESGLFNGLCPRNPQRLKEKMQEEDFAKAMKRRAQTEARIGILKNVFLDGTPRAKGFYHRELQVCWAVLSHNLWVLARLPWAKKSSQKLLAA